MRRLDTHDRLEVIPSQLCGQRDATAISVEEGSASAWIVADGGVKVGGARAVALALAVGRQARWPLLPWKVPGVARMLDAIYRVIATNRRRLPGDTPWCVEHGDACEPTAD